MKHIIILMASLFHIVCSADCVTTAPSQQSWNNIISDSNIEIDYQNNNAMHTAYIPNQVTFSTQHKSSRHHSPIPQYDLHRMSTAQLARYFRALNYTEGEVLSHPMLYTSQAYLAIVKQLPRYPEFVEKYYNRYCEYEWFHEFCAWITFRYKYGMKEQFARLYKECEKKRNAQEAHEQKQREIKAQQEQEIRVQKQQKADDYCIKINAVRHDDEVVQAIPAHHQQSRHTAYTQIKTATLDTITRNYTVESDTITFAQEYNITEVDLIAPRGNIYEHQLHSEFLEQLHEIHTISTYYALQPNNLLIDAVGHGVAIGMEANRLQQPETATIWANFGWKTLEIIKGIGDGLLVCAENTAHCIQDPKHALTEFVYALGNITGYCARTIGTGMRWHELMEQGNYLLMAQEMDDVANKIALCGTLCADKLSTLSAREIAKSVTYIVADIAITHKMLMLDSHLCSELKPIVFDLIKNIRTEEVLVELAVQGTEEFGSAGKISLLMEETEANSIKNAFSSSKVATEELTIEHALERWQKSESLKQLKQQCAQLGDTVADTRLGLCENPNLSLVEFEKLEKTALQKYAKIRSTLDDINAVAKNTGIDIDIIRQIKEHVFINEHILWDGIKRFPPDINMANAWERLVSNTFLKSDLEFLKHEYAESILMGKCKTSWRKAHDITDIAYNWINYLQGKT